MISKQAPPPLPPLLLCSVVGDPEVCEAVMKFHGVGDPDKTPAEATALQMGRDLLATVIGMGAGASALVFERHAVLCLARGGDAGLHGPLPPLARKGNLDRSEATAALRGSAPRSFRMSAEVVNAVGHFVEPGCTSLLSRVMLCCERCRCAERLCQEILAAIFSGIVAFLYLGPVPWPDRSAAGGFGYCIASRPSRPCAWWRGRCRGLCGR